MMSLLFYFIGYVFTFKQLFEAMIREISSFSAGDRVDEVSVFLSIACAAILSLVWPIPLLFLLLTYWAQNIADVKNGNTIPREQRRGL